MRERLSRRQRDVMTKIAGGLRLLAAPDMTCWLYDVSKPNDYQPVERVATYTAERLVMRDLVSAYGHLRSEGWAALGRPQP